jgi:hypothetical protein
VRLECGDARGGRDEIRARCIGPYCRRGS